MKFLAGEYDVAVIGAGHAGIEAALAAARLGCSTVIFTINLDWVGNMPCNPCIGGTAKGHLVREIDAMGGEMGRAADATMLQSRMLNRGKGPAVHSLRAQIDRREYSTTMKHTLETTEHLHIKQGEIVSLTREPDGFLLTTRLEAQYRARAVILATGTFLKGKIFVGDVSYDGGPDGMFAATSLTQSLLDMGVALRRFKTGTPARVLRSTVDFTGLEEQPGDEPVTPFSFETTDQLQNRCDCHITWTNEKTKQVILDNLHRSPLYGGKIEGVGPRYCPSIETKIVTFPDKEQHQLFLEPEGETTQELYLNGFSSSLPMNIQIEALKKVPAFKDLVIYRPGYAIEYDYFDPTQLKHTLESKRIKNLFFAGQVNGTTGYEEAAGQGIIAGINAHINCHGGEPFTLARDEAYIGVLIDDLVTKGVDEPYRMFTSRAEYRILLRMDDADMRLTEKAWKLGLVKEDRYELLKRKREAISNIVEFTRNYSMKPALINPVLEQLGTTPLRQGCKLIDLINRPQVTLENMAEHVDAFRRELNKVTERKEEIIEAAEILIKYEGYIGRERIIADKLARLESIKIKGKFNYNSIQSLSTEARQKLVKIDPETIAQASRIPGVSPSDINVLLVLSGR